MSRFVAAVNWKNKYDPRREGEGKGRGGSGRRRDGGNGRGRHGRSSGTGGARTGHGGDSRRGNGDRGGSGRGDRLRNLSIFQKAAKVSVLCALGGGLRPVTPTLPGPASVPCWQGTRW